MQLKVANFSVSFRTTLNAVVFVMSTLHVCTSIVLPADLAAWRMVSLSLESRVLSRDMRAILVNFFWAKSDEVVTPIPGPLPMTRRPSEDIVR